MGEHPAHKIQNKKSKHSQYSKGLEKDTEKCRLLKTTKQSAGNCNPQDANVCMYTNTYILSHLLLYISPIV